MNYLKSDLELEKKLHILKRRFKLIGLKAEFEAEGSTVSDIHFLRRLTKNCNTKLFVKIGGVEAINDIYNCIEIGVDGIIAPMVETKFALYKFKESIMKLDIKNKGKKYKVAYHSACSMQHGQKVHSQPVSLLEKTNNEIMEIPEGHICCGSAGTYNILQSKIAKQLLKKKVNNIESLNPDFISTGNIGCITQIAHGTKVPILHTIEVLDWYTGGPKPEILK